MREDNREDHLVCTQSKLVGAGKGGGNYGQWGFLGITGHPENNVDDTPTILWRKISVSEGNCHAWQCMRNSQPFTN